jgi:hypothetical protein
VTITMDDIRANQPKRTTLLTVQEFMQLGREAWSHKFSTRVGKRAGKLYREAMGRAPRKRRSKVAGRNATGTYSFQILEEAVAQVQAEIVAMAEKLGIQDWVETPSTWPGEGLRSKAEDAADKLQAEFPGLTRQDAITIHRATRDRKPRFCGTGTREHNTPADLYNQIRYGIEEDVKAEYGADLTHEELELLVRMRLRKDPELSATMARLEVLAGTRPSR